MLEEKEIIRLTTLAEKLVNEGMGIRAAIEVIKVEENEIEKANIRSNVQERIKNTEDAVSKIIKIINK